MTDLLVRRAELADAPMLSDLWRAGAERQRQAGTPSWTEEMVSEASAEAYIALGEAHLVVLDASAVAAFLLQDEDGVFWDDRPLSEALYLHRIAVDPAASGGQATRVIADWAAAEAVRRGRYLLRLDCAPQQKLGDVYLRMGFAQVDRCVKAGWDVLRFERRLSR